MKVPTGNALPEGVTDPPLRFWDWAKVFLTLLESKSSAREGLTEAATTTSRGVTEDKPAAPREG